MLGVPLGSDERVASYVESKLFGKLPEMVDRLTEFDDIQSAFFLLRVSFTIVRAVHFMRTTPLAKWRVQAEKFDSSIRSAAESILGLTNVTVKLASLLVLVVSAYVVLSITLRLLLLPVGMKLRTRAESPGVLVTT